jgi:hypothetical protein
VVETTQLNEHPRPPAESRSLRAAISSEFYTRPIQTSAYVATILVFLGSLIALATANLDLVWTYGILTVVLIAATVLIGFPAWLARRNCATVYFSAECIVFTLFILVFTPFTITLDYIQSLLDITKSQVAISAATFQCIEQAARLSSLEPSEETRSLWLELRSAAAGSSQQLHSVVNRDVRASALTIYRVTVIAAVILMCYWSLKQHFRGIVTACSSRDTRFSNEAIGTITAERGK